MTPLGRLRKATRLLDAIEAWAEKTAAVPDDALAMIQQANGFVAVTARDVLALQREVRGLRAAKEGPR